MSGASKASERRPRFQRSLEACERVFAHFGLLPGRDRTRTVVNETIRAMMEGYDSEFAETGLFRLATRFGKKEPAPLKVLAKLLGVKSGNVITQWRRKGRIPESHCARLSELLDNWGLSDEEAIAAAVRGGANYLNKEIFAGSCRHFLTLARAHALAQLLMHEPYCELLEGADLQRLEEEGVASLDILSRCGLPDRSAELENAADLRAVALLWLNPISIVESLRFIHISKGAPLGRWSKPTASSPKS